VAELCRKMAEEWYKRREDILARRLYLKPVLDAIALQVRTYFEAFKPDPVSGEAVFDVTYDSPESHPAGTISVLAITGATLTIGLPAESLNLVVNPVPKLARDTRGIVSGLEPGLPVERMKLVFVVNPNTTYPLLLRQVLDEYVKHALRN